jgi:hypothetical protein
MARERVNIAMRLGDGIELTPWTSTLQSVSVRPSLIISVESPPGLN